MNVSTPRRAARSRRGLSIPALTASAAVVAALCLVFGARPGVARDRLKVVTTLTVLKNIAEEVGGGHIAAQSLSDPRQDPHFVQPRPTLMKRAREADVFIEVGLQLELWAQKVVDGSGNPKIQSGQPGRIIASTGIATLELPTGLSREWGDVHPYGNPHLWLDPLNVKKMAANIAAGLESVDPANADDYRRRLEDFQRRIDEALFGAALVEEIGGRKLTRLAERGRLFKYLDSAGLRGKLGGWLERAEPIRGREIVTYHKTWIYFATRFGFSILKEIEEKPGIPPSAKYRDGVIQTVKRRHVPILLVAIFYDPTAANYIAGKTGARVVQAPIDPGAVPEVHTYFDLIGYLIDAVTTPIKAASNG